LSQNQFSELPQSPCSYRDADGRDARSCLFVLPRLFFLICWVGVPVGALRRDPMRFRFLAGLALGLAAAWCLTTGSANAQTVSTPVVHGNLAIYPVHGTSVGSPAPVTLEAAMASGQARIREIPGGKHTIDNLSDRAIFIQVGDMVKGGSQDQVAISSMLVPPGVSNFVIGLFCVERDRFVPLHGTIEFSSAGLIPSQAAKLSLLTHSQASPTPDLLRRVGVWLGVESVMTGLSQRIGTPVRSAISPSSLPQALEGEAVVGAYQPYVDALEKFSDSSTTIVGVVVAVNGRLYGAELYASNELFRAAWPKLLRAFAIQAVAVDGAEPELPPAITDASAFLTNGGTGNADGTLELVLRRPNGEWVHKSLVAKVNGATTPLEAAVIHGLATNLSVPPSFIDGQGFVNRLYQEAILIQSLATTVADREAAIAQARRASLPVDPERALGHSWLPPPDVGSSHSYGNLGTLAVLAMLLFAISALLRRRLVGRHVRLMTRVPAIRANPTRATATCQFARRVPKAKAWDWFAVTSGTTSVPIIPRPAVPRPEDDTREEGRQRLPVTA
jgi:hypothetical protein